MKRLKKELTLPEKTHRILRALFIVLFLIALRIWHLSVMQHTEKVKASLKPQRRVVIERGERATIYDRFGIPLAINKVQYNAAVCYSSIREIPRVIWKENEAGKRVKHFYRKEYIENLSKILAEELDLEKEKVEDLIHSKASILGNIPYLIKENISETSYFRLKMLEKDWPAIRAEQSVRRHYPLGPCAAEIVGYMGAINNQEYNKILNEMHHLEGVILKWEEGEEESSLTAGYTNIEEVKKRLKQLESKAYTLNDVIGKIGVEKSYDEKLRGSVGVKTYLSDPKGNFLQELPSSTPKEEGSRLYLTISAELQEYAERLLTMNEEYGSKLEKFFPEEQPWIKGGAIVVMEPCNGQVLALASYPRFNPNDFIRGDDASARAMRISQWLENEDYIASIWNEKQLLKRERYNREDKSYYEESLALSFEAYLNMTLLKNSELSLSLKKMTLDQACALQRNVERLLSFFGSLPATKVFNHIYSEEGQHAVQITTTLPEKELLEKCYKDNQLEISALKEDLKRYFKKLSYNRDKLLLVDITRLIVDSSKLPLELSERISHQSLSTFKSACASFTICQDIVYKKAKQHFHSHHFKKWREQHFKEYLDHKRDEEEKKKRYARPYIEYLEEAESQLFKDFWQKNKWECMLAFFQSESMQPTQAYWHEHYMHLKTILKEMDPSELIPYLCALQSYEELEFPLYGQYSALRNSGVQIGKDLAAAFYPKQGFGFARSYAFRQATAIGSIFKLIPAYEALEQRYMLQTKHSADLNPLTIIDDKHKKGKSWNVGYTEDKRPIPRFYRGGRLPRSEHAGIGSVDLVHALGVSSNPYFAILSGDFLEDPEDLCEAARLFSYGEKTGIALTGEIPGHVPMDVCYDRSGLYELSIGQHSLVGTPLQTAVMLSTIANGGKVLKPQVLAREVKGKKSFTPPKEVKREIFLPKPIQHLLIKGLREVVMGEKGTGRNLKELFDEELCARIVGKTSTAEVMERVSLDSEFGVFKVKHVGFGAIAYEDREHAKPELVVVVYLRFGDWGKDAAPLAAKMIQKWEEIKDRGR